MSSQEHRFQINSLIGTVYHYLTIFCMTQQKVSTETRTDAE